MIGKIAGKEFAWLAIALVLVLIVLPPVINELKHERRKRSEAGSHKKYEGNLDKFCVHWESTAG